jgi:hypothetical protein
LKIEHEQIVFLLERELEGVLRFGRGIHLALQRGDQGFAHHPQKRDVIVHHEEPLWFSRHASELTTNGHEFTRLNLSFLGSARASLANASPARTDGASPSRTFLIRVNSCPFVVNPTSELASALRERLAIIQDAVSRRDPEKHIERLRVISEKIDNLAAALPKPIDPELAHFLQRKSYDKALEHLEGCAPPRS